MEIPSSLEVHVAHSVYWRRCDVADLGVLDRQDLWDQSLEQLLVIPLVPFAAPSPVMDALQHLVVSRPQSQARVVPRPPHLFFHFLLYVS